MKFEKRKARQLDFQRGCRVLNLKNLNARQPHFQAEVATRVWLFICCKIKLKKKFFFEKNVFYKIYIICRKNVFIWEKKVLD